MAKFLFPSSFECDCGQELHFFENSIREMKKMSKKKRVTLGGDKSHSIIFFEEEAIEIICPQKGVCSIEDS